MRKYALTHLRLMIEGRSLFFFPLSSSLSRLTQLHGQTLPSFHRFVSEGEKYTYRVPLSQRSFLVLDNITMRCDANSSNSSSLQWKSPPLNSIPLNSAIEFFLHSRAKEHIFTRDGPRTRYLRISHIGFRVYEKT